MRIVISNSAKEPIYEQIKTQLRAAIFSKEVKEGDALPSIRQLAKELRVSVITTTRAYGDLVEEGLLTNMQGRGFFVNAESTELAQERAMVDIEEYMTKAITSARLAGIDRKEFIAMLEVIAKEEEYE